MAKPSKNQSVASKTGKTQIVNSKTGSSTPFLRGILTSSLQEAGLRFHEAYELASRVRREIANLDELSSSGLRARVAARLAATFDEEFHIRYLTPPSGVEAIMVTARGGQSGHFSPERMVRSLESSALYPAEAKAVVSQVQKRLIREKKLRLSSHELSHVTYLQMLEDLNADKAQRYLVWLEFVRSGRPLILLIGGTNGTGKSTIAAEVAHSLNIVRFQSSDMLREVMRKMVPDQLLPALHTSTFRAWETLPGRNFSDSSHESLVREGFLTQAEQVAVAIEGVLDRAIRERVSLVLEGIHLHPALQNTIIHRRDAIIIPITLAVLKPDQLRRHIRGRSNEAPSRRAERYLQEFDNIWQLQTFLLNEADRCDVSIINNNNIEKATVQVLDTVIGVLSNFFHGNPTSLFDAEAL